jgi:hypothetical protein
MKLSITILCHHTECRILFIVVLNVVMLSVVMLSVFAPNQDTAQHKHRVLLCLVSRFFIVMLGAFMLSAFMLSAFMLSSVMAQGHLRGRVYTVYPHICIKDFSNLRLKKD